MTATLIEEWTNIREGFHYTPNPCSACYVFQRCGLIVKQAIDHREDCQKVVDLAQIARHGRQAELEHLRD
jgi:hypothetical protein